MDQDMESKTKRSGVTFFKRYSGAEVPKIDSSGHVQLEGPRVSLTLTSGQAQHPSLISKSLNLGSKESSMLPPNMIKIPDFNEECQVMSFSKQEHQSSVTISSRRMIHEEQSGKVSRIESQSGFQQHHSSSVSVKSGFMESRQRMLKALGEQELPRIGISLQRQSLQSSHRITRRFLR